MPKGVYEREPPHYTKTGVKICADCLQEKDVEEFKTLTNRLPNRRYSYCKACAYEKERKRWSRLSQKEQRSKWLKTKYGLDWDAYESMYTKQRGRCAVCRITISLTDKDNSHTVACVDHDHEIGHIRGLLCNHCNRAIGLLKDDSSIAMRMVNYLEGM